MELLARESLPSRWRTAADAVTFALGLNVWVSILFVPGLFVGALRSPVALALALLPLLPLGVAVFLRSGATLLLGYPAALLAAIAYDPRIASQNVYGPVTFTVIAVGLVAYLLGASFLAAFREPPAPERLRRLAAPSARTPSRWRRRFRLYTALTVLSALFPCVLLYAVNVSPRNLAYLRELYPGRISSMTTLLNVGVLALWLGIYSAYFLGLLRLHRTGDRALTARLQEIRVEARRGTPRLPFYVAVGCALLFMGLLVLLRYR